MAGSPTDIRSHHHSLVLQDSNQIHLTTPQLNVPWVRLTPPSLPPTDVSDAHLCEAPYLHRIPNDANGAAFENVPLSVPKGSPPPYHSHHEIVDSCHISRQLNSSSHVPENINTTNSIDLSNQSSADYANTNSVPKSFLTVTPTEICRTNHPPNTMCKTCNNARSTYRKNAANLVRRASSGASLLKRKSAKLRSSFHTEVDLEESQSILSRLRKEWQDRKGGSKSLGNIPNSENSDILSGSNYCLSSKASTKPTESLRFELSAFSRSLSKKKWVIQENRAFDHIHNSAEGSYILSNEHATSASKITTSPSRHSGLESESSSRSAIVFKAGEEASLDHSTQSSKNPSAAAKRQQNSAETIVPKDERFYYDVDLSDNDSTYDTLIIKNIPELNDSNTTDGCDCSDACAVLSDNSKAKSRSAYEQKTKEGNR
jgi:hypothetical protein